MEYVYAAMLLHKAGKQVTEDAVKKVLESAGVKPDDARVKALVAALEGVDIEEAIKEAATTPAVASPVAQAPAAQAREEKKEAREEKKPEEAEAGLGSLFG